MWGLIFVVEKEEGEQARKKSSRKLKLVGERILA
jgi:hypothetical protein